MGVRTGVHYWPAVHRQPPFAAHGPRDRNGHGPTYLGTAVRWSEEELSLPMFAELTPAEVTRVTEAIEEALEEARR
jgi:dTDP-4-amino-4,6-dideoxygalactose transaminase